jgi:hypothetical protein
MNGDQRIVATVGLLLVLFVIFGIYRSTISAILFNSASAPGAGPLEVPKNLSPLGGSTGTASGPRDYLPGSSGLGPGALPSEPTTNPTNPQGFI